MTIRGLRTMSDMAGPRWAAGLVAVIAVLWGSVCMGAEPGMWLVSRHAVAGTDVKIVWQHNVPMRGGEELARLKLLDRRVYALTNQNYLTSLNAKDGQIVFSSYVALAGLPVVGLHLHEGALISVVGNDLVEISTDFGTVMGQRTLRYGITCPAMRNDSFYYVAGTDERLHVYDANNGVRLFEASAQPPSVIRSILAGDDIVMFATQSGKVVGMEPGRPVQLWDFDVPGEIASGMVRDGDALYLASKDTNVYKLSVETGELLWKYQTEGILDSAPEMGRQTVYQRVKGAGLTALSKETGEFLWQVEGGTGMLCETDERVYVLTDAAEIAGVKSRSREIVFMLRVEGASLHATNARDAKMYIADREGRIACLEAVR